MDKSRQQDHPFINLVFNIAMPVLVLQRLSAKLGPTNALILALMFPLGYGLYDYLRNKNKNWISILGLVNTLFTGGFALLHIEGTWFAVKEASFPLVLGIAVLLSSIFNKPVMKKMFFTPAVFNVSMIEQKISEISSPNDLHRLFRQSTNFLAISFFLSSALNFALASYVFSKIDPNLVADQRTQVLNDQIAQMTWLSFIVIVLPLMLFMGFIFWHLISRLKRMTGLSTDEILVIK